ncbi:MAG: T9SS type A sorting domain-containing protein [candidate division KSB1 bacterium]|nr:T9SS type A sorting domain-containing protein [candidate division KSB1 bacterium]MDZ7303138.1 T9SS type A sorting domain-containing protein [candidate division KSB1 bacterium]MDZ7310119.1 T9SS type A sorting domain-containing protein [candidate division KSB1 bacterium]
MRRVFFLLLFLFSFRIFAQEHSVPAGTEGNRLLIAIQNASYSPLLDIRVAVLSAPTWIVFKTSSVGIDSIAPKAWRDVCLDFSVLELAGGQTGIISLAITDAHGCFLGDRMIRLRGVPPPHRTELLSSYPNPAYTNLRIQYALHVTSHIKLEIYNILGQCVRTLLDEEKLAGTFVIDWDGRNDHGMSLPSGTYWIRLAVTEKGKNKEEQFSSRIIIRK